LSSFRVDFHIETDFYSANISKTRQLCYDPFMIPHALALLSSEMEHELRTNILPFWPRFVDRRKGGFYGSVGNDGSVEEDAPKGVVMTARHLWAYSAASIHLRDPSHLETAEIAYRFLTERVYDAENKGFFWLVARNGTPLDPCKRVYGQAYAVYALSEYARARGQRRALDIAMETFVLLERAARDREHGGYYEAVARDWSGPQTAALSTLDMDCPKSMNTNLHVLEAFTSLLRASGDPAVREALRDLVEIHIDRVMTSPSHVGLFFENDWTSLEDAVSFGHDIEASWLLAEAASVAWEGPLPERTERAVLEIASGTAEALTENGGSLPNERRGGHFDADRVWWVQAEAIVGMVNAWQISGDRRYLDLARGVWEFVKGSIIDREHGEWLWGVHEDGRRMEGREKGGPWKASYHNSRACMEIMNRAAAGVARAH
jgi:mannobiose 2-epimerase